MIDSGSVYTLPEIAHSIVSRTLSNLQGAPSDFKVLDFACGTGRFYRQIVQYYCYTWNIAPDTSVVKNVYAVDIDPISVNICRLLALSLCSEPTEDVLKAISSNIICRNALIRNIFYSNKALTHEDLNGLHEGHFDAVVSNPPYLVLKPNKRNVIQATCIFHLTKGRPSDKIAIENQGKEYCISIRDVQQLFGENFKIPSVDKTEWDILRLLSKMPKVKDKPEIRNKRGELDITLCGRYFCQVQRTGHEEPEPYRAGREAGQDGRRCDIWAHHQRHQ